MKPCTILEFPRVYDILSTFLGTSDVLHWNLKQAILGGASRFFLWEDTCISFEPMGHGKYQVHIYSVSRDSRGKGLRDFAVRASRWMLNNTDAKVFLNFVKVGRLDLKLFMKMIGSKRMGAIPGSDEILYVSTGDMGIKEE
jgi:hypothetical protein